MKSTLVALSLIVFTPSMFPYGSLIPQGHGNPNKSAYIGEAGSPYDSGANPAQTNGTVSYDPLAPLASVAPPAPSGSAMPVR